MIKWFLPANNENKNEKFSESKFSFREPAVCPAGWRLQNPDIDIKILPPQFQDNN